MYRAHCAVIFAMAQLSCLQQKPCFGESWKKCLSVAGVEVRQMRCTLYSCTVILWTSIIRRLWHSAKQTEWRLRGRQLSIAILMSLTRSRRSVGTAVSHSVCITDRLEASATHRETARTQSTVTTLSCSAESYLFLKGKRVFMCIAIVLQIRNRLESIQSVHLLEGLCMLT